MRKGPGRELLVAVLCNDAAPRTVALAGLPAGRELCDIHRSGTVCFAVDAAGAAAGGRPCPLRQRLCVIVGSRVRIRVLLDWPGFAGSDAGCGGQAAWR